MTRGQVITRRVRVAVAAGLVTLFAAGAAEAAASPRAAITGPATVEAGRPATFDASGSAPPRETASAGATVARLFYERGEGGQVSGLRIEILRGGVLARSTAVEIPNCRDLCGTVTPVGAYSGRSVEVTDLDRDGEPEVVLGLAVGNICCRYTFVYRYDGRGGYARFVHNCGASAAGALRDFDGDGRPEWRSGDGAIRYVFGCGACAPYPVQVWSFTGERFIDVTPRFPRLVRQDARRQWREYRRARGRYPVAGTLAAWVVDQHSLGRGRRALREVDRAIARGDVDRQDKFDTGPRGKAFRRVLLRWLKREGYR